MPTHRAGGYSPFISSKLHRGFLILVVASLFILACPYSVWASDALSALEIPAKSALLVDVETGRILVEKVPDQALPVASMSKMMTEYLVLEKVKKNELTWNTPIRISPYAAAVSIRDDLSNVPLTLNGTYTVRELLEAVAVCSANAAAVALAETIGGSEEKFAALMNGKAAELGLTGSHFVNSTGLEMTDVKEIPAWCEGRNTMTAMDCAKLAYRIIRDFSDMLSISSIAKKTFGPNAYPMESSNQMLPGLDYEYAGMKGLKTGYTEMAGYCLTGVYQNADALWISVVIGAPDSKTRFGETRKLLDLSKVYSRRIMPAELFYLNQKFGLEVGGIDHPLVPAMIKDPMVVLVKDGETDPVQPIFIPDPSFMDERGYPKTTVGKGRVIGYCVFRLKEGMDRFIDEESERRSRAPVYALEDLEPENPNAIEFNREMVYSYAGLLQ